MIEFSSIKFGTEEGFTGPLVTADARTPEGAYMRLSACPETGTWRVFFLVEAGTDMPSWSHGPDCLGVTPRVFADRRTDEALTMAALASAWGNEAVGLYNRALMEIEGQLELPL